MTRTLTAQACLEAEIKRSRFIAHAIPCRDEQQAREFLQVLKDPSANHHCWAWKSGQQYRFDDDGEPGGTAGRPILQAIEGQDMDQVAVVVIRHFGGIKLGTGGLARAYGGTAAECLRTADSKPIIHTSIVACRVPFEAIALVHQLIDRHQAVKLAETYSSDGIELTVELPSSELNTWRNGLRDATAGAAEIRSA